MINHVLANLAPLGASPVVVVVAPGMESVAKAVAPHATAIQDKQLGTGHAVLAARKALGEVNGDLLIVYGDAPLISTSTLQRLVERRRAADKPAVVVLGMRTSEGEYGRLIVNAKGNLDDIVEHAEATPEQRAIGLCNSGVMAVDGKRIWELLASVGKANSKGEYYLTDIVALARKLTGLPPPRLKRRSTSCRASTAGPSSRLPKRRCRRACAGAPWRRGRP